jgi:hypothetical protein
MKPNLDQWLAATIIAISIVSVGFALWYVPRFAPESLWPLLTALLVMLVGARLFVIFGQKA